MTILAPPKEGAEVPRTDVVEMIFGQELKPDLGHAFLEQIGRPDLQEKLLNPLTPMAYVCMEAGIPATHEFKDRDVGIYGAGGLGMLAGDEVKQTSDLGLPMLLISPYHTARHHQAIFDLWQLDVSPQTPHPTELGLKKIAQQNLRTGRDEVPFEIYAGTFNGIPIVTSYHANFGRVYEDGSNTTHRLYQDTSLMLIFKTLAELGVAPSMHILNESATVPYALAQLDHYCQKGMSVETALELFQEKSIGTNHTLVAAAAPVYNQGQFEHVLLPNIENDDLRNWVRGLIYRQGGNMSNMLMELAGRFNGVSKLHAAKATEEFGKKHEAVTNGIYLPRWVSKDLMNLYHEKGVLDEFELPAEGYQEAVKALDPSTLRTIKRDAKHELVDYLATRMDQYGRSVAIPPEAKVAYWARRIAGYKRPGLPFHYPEKLAEVLTQENMHLVIGGKTHHQDDRGKQELNFILNLIQNSKGQMPDGKLVRDVIRERVHFIQDYDEELAKRLAAGGDILVNTPIVGLEACGTSIFKGIGNMTMVVSTPDGGMADVDPPTYCEVTGNNTEECAESLYTNLRKASQTIDSDDETWGNSVKTQFAAYLPTICASRMIKDYVNFFYPPDQTEHAA